MVESGLQRPTETSNLERPPRKAVSKVDWRRWDGGTKVRNTLLAMLRLCAGAVAVGIEQCIHVCSFSFLQPMVHADRRRRRQKLSFGAEDRLANFRNQLSLPNPTSKILRMHTATPLLRSSRCTPCSGQEPSLAKRHCILFAMRFQLARYLYSDMWPSVVYLFASFPFRERADPVSDSVRGSAATKHFSILG